MPDATRSLDPESEHTTGGNPPADQSSDSDPDVAEPLRGSEASSTVDRRAHQERADPTGRDGDLADGDEGSATGSRTPGQDEMSQER